MTTLFERKSISTQILRYKEVIKCMPAQKVSCNIWHSFRAWFEMHDATNIPGMLGFPNIYVLIIFVWNQAEFLYFQMIKEKLKRGGNSMNNKIYIGLISNTNTIHQLLHFTCLVFISKYPWVGYMVFVCANAMTCWNLYEQIVHS